jgi:hypothetical protein
MAVYLDFPTEDRLEMSDVSHVKMLMQRLFDKYDPPRIRGHDDDIIDI